MLQRTSQARSMPTERDALLPAIRRLSQALTAEAPGHEGSWTVGLAEALSRVELGRMIRRGCLPKSMTLGPHWPGKPTSCVEAMANS
jgi:hypothetical protein